MSSNSECADIQLLLPELALGSLTGQDRARALQHLVKCSACRRELQALTDVGDELLLLAPKAEPPVGFESRLVERLGAEGGAPRSWSRRWLAIAAAVLLAASLGGAAVYVTTGADRRVAERYRRTLAVAEGDYFAARPLRGADGSAAGSVFGYQGSPSWVFCVVRNARPAAVYEIHVASKDGGEWMIGEMSTARGAGTWGGRLPVDLHDLRQIEFVPKEGGRTLVADWSTEG